MPVEDEDREVSKRYRRPRNVFQGRIPHIYFVILFLVLITLLCIFGDDILRLLFIKYRF